MVLTRLNMMKWVNRCPVTTETWTKLVNPHMLEFPAILNKGTVENIQLLLKIDHLTNKEDEAKLEEGGEHPLLNTYGGGGDHGLDNNGGVDNA
mgnify:CR=1 FL=1